MLVRDMPACAARRHTPWSREWVRLRYGLVVPPLPPDEVRTPDGRTVVPPGSLKPFADQETSRIVCALMNDQPLSPPEVADGAVPFVTVWRHRK